MLIFLVGFMGCGKSYTAKYLANELNIPYVDMDQAIEMQHGKTIPQIFEEEGELVFRNLEHEYLKALNPEYSRIISTGGGTPCYHNNMALMNSTGTTIFIDSDKQLIVERLLRGIHKRPLLQGMNEHDLGFFYDQKMKERRPFYEQANFQVKHQDYEVLQRLIQSLEK
jgi:shikimate kinase